MKITTKTLSYADVCKRPVPAHKKPSHPSKLLREVIRLVGKKDLKDTHFTYTNTAKDLLEQPCLVLMNHSCFLDLEMASTILYPKPFGIVCTSDGFVGKEGLMRAIGCIPTKCLLHSAELVEDIKNQGKNIGVEVDGVTA